MIGSLHGEVAHIGLDNLTLIVSGVGFRVQTTPATLAEIRLGQETTIATSLVVREDSLSLFGFLTDDERDTYEQLQTVSGVGPKLALAMLAVLSPDELRDALEKEDLKTLQKVPGVGPKSAKRLVLELQGKLGPSTTQVAAAEKTPAGSGHEDEVLQALVSLGWNGTQAERAIDTVLAHMDSNVQAPQLLRAALVELGGKHRG